MGQLLATPSTYLLHGQLAAGGMGEIFAGTLVSPAGRRRVAIKRLPAEWVADGAARQRLIAEAQLVFQLTHANICQVLDLGESEEGTFIVMEYVQGADLGRLMRFLRQQGRRLAVANAVFVAREVCRALDYAHRRASDQGRPLALVHGDVTPRNILLSVEGEVKLTDFGIARALTMTMAGPGSLLRGGTPGYMAPEATGAAMDHRADIYSLGMSLYAALVGRRPAQTGVSPAQLRQQRDDVSTDLAQTVARMTARDPSDRFASAAEVEHVLATELARRHPGFMPTSMATDIHACTVSRPADTPWESPGCATELTSIARTETTTPGHELSPEKLPVGTRSLPMTPARPGQRRRVIVVGGVAAAIAAVAVLLVVGIWNRSPRRIDSPAAGGDRKRAKGALRVATPAVDAGAGGGAIDLSAAARQRPAVRLAAASRHARPRRRSHARRRSTTRKTARPLAEPAFLTVSADPWGKVYVDGKRVAEETPLYRYRLSPGRHVVRVFYPSKGLFSDPRPLVLRPGETRTLGFKQ
jgi:serine/threonine protein kinase